MVTGTAKASVWIGAVGAAAAIFFGGYELFIGSSNVAPQEIEITTAGEGASVIVNNNGNVEINN